MYCINPRPWKLPTPFVAIIFKGFIGLIMLANANAAYERLEILSVSSDYMFAANIAVVSQCVIRGRFLPGLRG